MHDSVLPKLSAGDVITADKGFNVEDLLPAEDWPKYSAIHTRQMTTHEFFQNQGIASERIAVKMKMEQIKSYRILTGTLPLSEAHLAEQMVLNLHSTDHSASTSVDFKQLINFVFLDYW